MTATHTVELRYCDEKTALLGDAFRLLRLFTPPHLHERLAVISAFHVEMREMEYKFDQPALASLRLHWWQEEIDRATMNKATHPVTRQLSPWFEKYSAPAQEARRMISALIDRLMYGLTDEEKFDAYCLNRGGAFFRMLAMLDEHHEIDDTLMSQVESWGKGGERVHLLEARCKAAQMGVAVFPDDLLNRHRIDPVILTNPIPDSALTPLLEYIARQARNDLNMPLMGSGRGRQIGRAALKIPAMYGGLAYMSLGRLEHAQFDMAVTRTTHTPWRELWILWRSARRNRPPLI